MWQFFDRPGSPFDAPSRPGLLALADREVFGSFEFVEAVAEAMPGTGVAAYTREVAARTEQYWCPIKHARRIRDAHNRYPRFFDHGDAEAFRQGLARLRRQYDDGAMRDGRVDRDGD